MSAAHVETELLSKQENLERQLLELQKSASREKEDFISNQKNMNTKLQDAKKLELNLRRGRDSLQEQLFLEEYKLGKAEEKLATCEKRNTDLERESFELQNQLFTSSQHCIYASLVKICPLVRKITSGNEISYITKGRCDLED